MITLRRRKTISLAPLNMELAHLMSEPNSLQDNLSEDLYAGMNQIVDVTKSFIAEMNDGDRIAIDDLTDKVASKLSIAHSKALHTVRMFCKSPASKGSLEAGRTGGYWKGGKPKRVDLRPRCASCNQVVRPESSGKTISES